MILRGLRLATQFLTRLPVPPVKEYTVEDFSRSSAWFPVVGLIVGALVSFAKYIVAPLSGSLLAAAISLVVWVWVTGALHLDGLADLTDALAASHRDKQRFLAVLADPHIGTFGVVSIILVLMLKLAALDTVGAHELFAIPLILAWARLGTLAWGRWLDPLKPGHGQSFASRLHVGWIVFWTVVLLAASVATNPILCVAPIVIAAWGWWLYAKVGGATGDCLGAGVEITEVVLLVLTVTVGRL